MIATPKTSEQHGLVEALVFIITTPMKTLILLILATVAATSLAFAQVGYWTAAGLTPRTGTIDVNTNYNNNSLETGDISITANTNTVLAWEDDGDPGVTDFEA